MVRFKLQRSRLAAIQRFKQSVSVKGCKSFAGVVIYLSMLCPELEELLRAIYD